MHYSTSIEDNTLTLHFENGQKVSGRIVRYSNQVYYGTYIAQIMSNHRQGVSDFLNDIGHATLLPRPFLTDNAISELYTYRSPVKEVSKDTLLTTLAKHAKLVYDNNEPILLITATTIRQFSRELTARR